MKAQTGGAGALAAAISLCVGMTGCPPEREICVICVDAGGAPGAGAGGSRGPCGDTGRAFFEENVLPFLDDGTTGAACAACHSGAYQDPSGGPDFLGSSSAGAYNALTGDPRFVGVSPQNSLLVTKGVHAGPAFSASQQVMVEEWLYIEAEERSGDCADEGAPAGEVCDDALAAFGACMTLADWTGTGMHLVATQHVLEGGQCFGCHQGGMGANYMTKPDTDASILYGFERMRELPPLRRLATCAGGEAGALDVVPANRWRDKGLVAGHTDYFLADEHLAALDAWFALTHAKWKVGPCGPYAGVETRVGGESPAGGARCVERCSWDVCAR